MNKEKESSQGLVKNRREILFLYDIKDANPNGDPADENKPRIDDEKGINLVTDVRLKRTVRDYLYTHENKELFVRQIIDADGYIQDAKARAKDFLPETTKKDLSKLKLSEIKEPLNNAILEKCIDVRLFGATIPLEFGKKKGSITHTGPVQFKMGRSLHRVKLQHIKGTGAFASGEKKQQQTFREEWILPYSLICFYGIVNEAHASHTQLTEDDLQALYRGLWYGTKNLVSRSKAGQMPRLLLVVTYKEKYFHIGDLDKMITLKHNLSSDEEIRDISEVTLEIGKLIETLEAHKDAIKNIELLVDENVKFTDNDAAISDLNKYLTQKGLSCSKLSLDIKH